MKTKEQLAIIIGQNIRSIPDYGSDLQLANAILYLIDTEGFELISKLEYNRLKEQEASI